MGSRIIKIFDSFKGVLGVIYGDLGMYIEKDA